MEKSDIPELLLNIFSGRVSIGNWVGFELDRRHGGNVGRKEKRVKGC